MYRKLSGDIIDLIFIGNRRQRKVHYVLDFPLRKSEHERPSNKCTILTWSRRSSNACQSVDLAILSPPTHMYIHVNVYKLTCTCTWNLVLGSFTSHSMHERKSGRNRKSAMWIEIRIDVKCDQLMVRQFFSPA